ncbi:hypothetical protein GURKE_00030 [Brevundimonas phage vB_BpoS-Gurke]|uniref:Uncharacterized protein n=1 Tax=Brevundimonas phage vB_BpoS-Gurke TaxID=2948599 RepID=A0A9E7N4H2_9CAUD|nr:hypothetical protein GURKE_00030 [Brevundimonas phage vB_BpoS-Gurke]
MPQADEHDRADPQPPERKHGPRCWGSTSFSDEMAYCYCGDEPPADEA